MLWLVPVLIARLAAAGCALRRFLDSGAQTTRHDTAQSSGIEHVLWIVNATLASCSSACSKLAQVATERLARSATAGTTGTQIERARAHVAHRARWAVRMTDLQETARELVARLSIAARPCALHDLRPRPRALPVQRRRRCSGRMTALRDTGFGFFARASGGSGFARASGGSGFARAAQLGHDGAMREPRDPRREDAMIWVCVGRGLAP